MALEVQPVLQAMLGGAQGLGTEIWGRMQTYAIPELHKIAVQIVAIAENINDYTPAGAKALLDMQVKASLAVIAGMTELTLLAVQQAVNAILAAVRDMVNAALPFPLL